MSALGHGRGWLTDDAAAAASIARIDHQIGHPLQITDAGRTWDEQMTNYRAYLNGTGAYALHPDTPSIHQLGNAIDTDEGRNIDPIMRDHGWRLTALDIGEWWHWEYFEHLDNRRNDPPPAPPAPTYPKEETMQLHRWNGQHIFGIDQGVVFYVDHPDKLPGLVKRYGPWIEVGNDELTAIILSSGLFWDAFEAVLRGTAPGSAGRYWSREMAEGIAVRGAQAEAQKTLNDVLAAAQAFGTPITTEGA